ncbi:hypothetical protein [Salinibacterium sp. ZJ77]|uniref:hypothetical protein n=1 Tax=Salinibacterium sp. ZJ77 TaxID=2708337 RepID=UPI001423DA67|nr:hypothetical protein [Salinibacterium sp. ZJ77]
MQPGPRRRLLVDRPAAPGARGTLLILDFDDVLNACLNFFDSPRTPYLTPLRAPHLTRTRFRTIHGAKYEIAYDSRIVDALDALVHGYGLELAWLTTWGPNMRTVVEQAFGGRLAGGYILAKQPSRVRGRRDPHWKARALHDARVPTGNRPWIWADSDASGDTIAPAPHLTEGDTPRLLLAPPTGGYGLTPVDMERIRRFASRTVGA